MAVSSAFSGNNAQQLTEKLIKEYKMDGRVHWFGGEMDGCPVIIVTGANELLMSLLAKIVKMVEGAG